MQTSPVGTFPTTLRGAVPTIYAAEGLNGFYKSLVPLWGRQIPYTMMKFACFEKTVEALYAYVVPKPRAECSKAEQLVVTFAAGYIAGGNYPQKRGIPAWGGKISFHYGYSTNLLIMFFYL